MATWQYKKCRTFDLQHFSSLEGWGRLGHTASERVEACFTGETPARAQFFITLSPCCSWKFTFISLSDRGVVLSREAGKGNDAHQEYLMCKPLKPPQITIRVTKCRGDLVDVEWSTMSGRYGSDLHPVECRWRDCFAKTQRALYRLQLFNDIELLRCTYHCGLTQLKMNMPMASFLPPEDRPEQASPMKSVRGKGNGSEGSPAKAKAPEGKGNGSSSSSGKGTKKPSAKGSDSKKVQPAAMKKVLKKPSGMKKPSVMKK